MNDAVVKVNGYMHDDAGITVEDADTTNWMTKNA
jgi:hypothetical protein